MKYNATTTPLICMLTNNPCYKNTKTMAVKGVLWHSTGANNPNVKRYVQPSDNDPNKEALLKTLGKNSYNNDWNHTTRQVGVNAFIGKDASGKVITVQTMPWDQKPWGCGSGSKGSCNNGWIQFEICEDALTDANYFNQVYTEACEITAFLCKKFNIDPLGTAKVGDVTVPTILCHADSHALQLGNNHGDVLHWFKKHNKTMNDVRNDVNKLLKATSVPAPAEATKPAPGAAPIQLIGSTNEEKIWNYLLTQIKNPFGVAGLMANIKAESGFNPKNLQNTYEKSLGFTDDSYTTAVDNGTYTNFVQDKAGYGLCQWTYWSLKQALLDYAQKHNYSIGDLGFQLEFICWQLSNSYKAVWTTLLEAKTVAEASNSVMLKFERPANQSEENQAKRAGYGVDIYNKFATKKEEEVPMSVTLVHSSIDENGKARGGSPGDQTKKEVCTRAWYNRPWDAVIRFPDGQINKKAAAAGVKLANSQLVGYDQGDRNTLYKALEKNGWDVDKYIASKEKTECDCSSFVYACYSLFLPHIRSNSTAPRTGSMAATYKKWGFNVYTDASYTTKTNLLKLGDILVKANAHTVMVAAGVGEAPTTGTTPAPSTPISYTGKGVGTAVAQSTMNIRDKASTEGKSLGYVNKGATVEVLEVMPNGWYKIVTTKASCGYAYTSNSTGKYYTYTPKASTEPVASKPEFKSYIVKVTASALNVRSGPGTNHDIIAVIRNQGLYTIINEQGNFGQIKTGGWICLDYTKKQ